jgi:hypothetical protein
MDGSRFNWTEETVTAVAASSIRGHGMHGTATGPVQHCCLNKSEVARRLLDWSQVNTLALGSAARTERIYWTLRPVAKAAGVVSSRQMSRAFCRDLSRFVFYVFMTEGHAPNFEHSSMPGSKLARNRRLQ